MPQSEAQKPDNESKSQRKRDMLALQKMGESLMKLTDEQLKTIDLPDNLLTALSHIKSLTSHEAKRRQLQYIGKIMRHIDPAPIIQALKCIEFTHKKNTAHLHHIEEWRTRLLTQGEDALNAFLADYPDVERQPLRQLIRNAERDANKNKNTGAEKALFKFLLSMVKNKNG